MKSANSKVPNGTTPIIAPNGTTSEISFLENSIYYFLKCAFIKQENNGSRLVVTHQERLLLDRLYTTDRGAKIAFAKRYGDRLWQDGIRPKWSPVDETDL